MIVFVFRRQASRPDSIGPEWKRDAKHRVWVRIAIDCPDCEGEGLNLCPCCGQVTDACRRCGGEGTIMQWIPAREYAARRKAEKLEREQERIGMLLFKRYGTSRVSCIRDYWQGEQS